MPISCLFGFHDWYTVNEIPITDIQRQVATDLGFEHCPGSTSHAMVSHRYCLGCGKDDNSIVRYKNYYFTRMLLAMRHSIQARPPSTKMPNQKFRCNRETEFRGR